LSWGDDVRDDAFRHKLAGEGLAVAAIHVCAIGRLDHDSVRKAPEVTFYS
jgi:phosphotransferase system IIA component